MICILISYIQYKDDLAILCEQISITMADADRSTAFVPTIGHCSSQYGS